MQLTNRRHDIDWLRVIAIGLLLIYHIAIGFQPWGTMIGFIANPRPWVNLWIPMTMLNIWRIPLLFFVSGMGVYFAMQKRNWKQLIAERTGRIFIPFIFGMFCIVPLHFFIWQAHYHLDMSYSYDSGHLWFLGNIFTYVILLSPLLFYIKGHEQSKAVVWIKKIFSTPIGLLVVIGAFILEAILVNPYPYELYAKTWHGFFLGLLAFFFGFCFVLAGRGFWEMIVRWRWALLIAAISLYVVRISYFEMKVPSYLLVTESECWIFAVLAFGNKYLNHPSKALSYLSQAAYPVYILHMIFLYLGSMIIFPMAIPVALQFFLVLLFTGAGCFLSYELIRRINFLRPLFGLKLKESMSPLIRDGKHILN